MQRGFSKDPKVLYSITGMDRSPRKLENPSTIRHIHTSAKLRRLRVQMHLEMGRDAIWIRLLAGMEFDSDAIARLIKPIADVTLNQWAYATRMLTRNRATENPFSNRLSTPPLAQSGWLAPDGAAIQVAALPTDLDLTSSSAGELLIAAARHVASLISRSAASSSNAQTSRPRDSAAAH